MNTNLFIQHITKKIPFLFLIIFLGSLQSCAQPPETFLTYADRMVKEKKYKSAIELLDSLDPLNQNPDFVIKKTEIYSKYYVSSIMHQMFAMEDLKPNQKIEDLRRIEGNFKMKTFPANEILDSLILKYPKRYDLHNALTEYYYIIFKEYPEGWIIKKDELLKRLEHNGNIAIKNKMASATTYYVIGFLKSMNDEYNEAISMFTKAIEHDPYHAAAYYNLALSNMYIDSFQKALPYSQLAIENHEDSFGKSESCRLAGYICEELSDGSMAYNYFLQAWNLNKNNLDNIHALTDIAFRLQKPDAKRFADIYFETDPTNEEVYGGLVEIYAQSGKGNDVLTLFESKIETYKNDPKVLANIYYFSAGLIYKDDKKKAINYLEMAMTEFLKFLPSKHAIILTIEDKIEEFKR